VGFQYYSHVCSVIANIIFKKLNPQSWKLGTTDILFERNFRILMDLRIGAIWVSVSGPVSLFFLQTSHFILLMKCPTRVAPSWVVHIRGPERIQLKPFHIFTRDISEIHFNIILSPTPPSPVWFP
jgi:hypothetical protein